MVENVKRQIFAEFARGTVNNIWYSRSYIDIEILNKEKQFESLKEEKNRNIGILLCLSTEMDKTKANYWLPEQLPSNVKFKYILVESPGGDDSLLKDLMESLEKDSKISKLFKGSEILTLSPAIPSVYMNKKIDESSRQFFHFCYAICVSMLAKGYISRHFPMKK